jgi:diadenosine tetraphosphate (Ap4A) HIT family hydrolase
VAKQIAKASGAEDYNILQNNGRIAHQVVDHVRDRSWTWKMETRR